MKNSANKGIQPSLLHFCAHIGEVKMKCIAVALLLLRSLSPWAQVVPEKPNPKVRAITAFVRLDRTNFLQQIEDTLLVLRRAE